MEREHRELGTEKGGDRRLSTAKRVARGSTTKKADYPTFITIFPPPSSPCPLQGREIFKPSEFRCNPSRSEASSPTPVSHAMQGQTQTVSRPMSTPLDAGQTQTVGRPMSTPLDAGQTQTVSRPMNTPPSSHIMAQENYCGLASLPARRKRGRPRKDEVLVSEPPLISQRQFTNSPGTSSQDLVGRTVSGIVDGTFEGGYLLTVREGTSGQLFKGLVFDPRRSCPITPENDIAPHLPMVKWPSDQKQDQPRHEPAVASTKDQPVHQNVKDVQPVHPHEPALFHTPAQAMQQDVQAFQRIQKNDPASVHAPLHVGAVQPLKREEFTVMHQTVVTNPSPQRNGPTAFRVPSIPVQQNVKTSQPVQRNALSAIHTTLKQLVEQNVMPVQPLASDDSAANITRSDVVATTVDPSASAENQPLQAGVDNIQTAIAPIAFTADSQVDNSKSGEGVAKPPKEADADSLQIGSVKQISEPATVFKECHPQLEDACTNQLETRTPAAIQASASLGDLEMLQVSVTTAPKLGNPMLQVSVTTAPELGNPMLPPDGATETTGERV